MKINPYFSSVAKLLAAVFTAAFLTGVSSCGGGGQLASGVDSGGTGIVGAGPVTGLGSAIVNGVEYDLTNATIVDQAGTVLTADQISLGQMARLESSSAPVTVNGQKQAMAISVEVRSQIVGPVDSADTVANTLTAMGQTIQLTPATWIDPTITGGFSAALVGMVVEVYGQFDPARHIYVATRIAPHDHSAFKISGLVTSLDTTNKTITVGGITASYANIAVANLPTGLAVGNLIQSRLQVTPTVTSNGNIWTAANLFINRIALPDRNYVSMSGRITAWHSASNFDLDGIPVNAGNATFLSSASNVILGARVIVNGASRGGVLIATDVTALNDENAQNSTFELHGTITALNSVANYITVHGMKVYYTGQTTYQGGSATNLTIGASVKVTGTISADKSSLDAQTISYL